MPCEIVLPRDTQTEIDEFVETRCQSKEAALASVDTIQFEMEKLAANPTLGASPPGGPFESRRIHQFKVPLSVRENAVVELAYKVFWEASRIVFSGFRELQ